MLTKFNWPFISMYNGITNTICSCECMSNISFCLLAGEDYNIINFPGIGANRLPNNVINYKGGTNMDASHSFTFSTIADSDDTEPPECFYINIIAIRTVSILTLRIKVIICGGMYVYLSVCVFLPFCLSVCQFIFLSVHLSVCLSVCLSIRLSVCLCVCPSVCLSVRLSLRLSVHLSVHSSVHLPIRSSLHLGARLPACLYALVWLL